MKSILVTGGAGYIGLHLTHMLEKSGYKIIVLDNLSSGYNHPILKDKLVKGSISDEKLLNKVFQDHDISIIIHLAALTDVSGSIKIPIKYYENNVCQTLTLLNQAVKHSVKNFIFASSAAVFSHTPATPIDANYPTHPMTPYGGSKCLIECALKDCYTAYGLNSIIFRYFNVAGADSDLDLIDSNKKWKQLIPLVLQTARGLEKEITIFGDQYETPDGTGLRDYIHINDICSAHLAAIKKIENFNGSFSYNLGAGKGSSVKQVIEAAKHITKMPIKTTIAPARAGDSACVIADNSHAQASLDWSPRFSDLETMIETFWKWTNKN